VVFGLSFIINSFFYPHQHTTSVNRPKFFHAWKKGLKKGVYYLRSKAAISAIQITVNKTAKVQPIEDKSMEQKQADIVCSLDNPDECEACGS
jgi:hypothetical protein